MSAEIYDDFGGLPLTEQENAIFSDLTCEFINGCARFNLREVASGRFEVEFANEKLEFSVLPKDKDNPPYQNSPVLVSINNQEELEFTTKLAFIYGSPEGYEESQGIHIIQFSNLLIVPISLWPLTEYQKSVPQDEFNEMAKEQEIIYSHAHGWFRTEEGQSVSMMVALSMRELDEIGQPKATIFD